MMNQLNQKKEEVQAVSSQYSTNQKNQKNQKKQKNKEIVSGSNIQQESDITEKLKEIKEELTEKKIDEEIKKEKKRGRPGGSNYKSKKVIEQEKQEFAESIAGVGSFALNMVVQRMPNPIPLSSEEAQTFDNLFTKVIFKYSEAFGNYQEETALLSVGIMILFPRMSKPKEDKKELVKGAK